MAGSSPLTKSHFSSTTRSGRGGVRNKKRRQQQEGGWTFVRRSARSTNKKNNAAPKKWFDTISKALEELLAAQEAAKEAFRTAATARGDREKDLQQFEQQQFAQHQRNAGIRSH